MAALWGAQGWVLAGSLVGCIGIIEPQPSQLVDAAGDSRMDARLDAPTDATDATIEAALLDRSVSDVSPEASAPRDASRDALLDTPPAQCPAGTTRCASRCVSLMDDVAHCGACNDACVLPNALSQCIGGRCVLSRCVSGFGDCNTLPQDGCESALDSTLDCGRCFNRCPPSAPLCEASTSRCLSGCAAGLSRCSAQCASLATSLSHCGACDNACLTPHATPRCVAGACVIARCDPGWADCDGSSANGCEASLNSVRDCGACGMTCAGATPVCDTSAGRCSSGCPSGLSRCDGVCVDTLTDTSHCGACTSACSFANAVARCASGRCALSRCVPGSADCDGNPSNGCETSTSSISNCGTCGNRCAPAQAVPACTNGVCRVASCDAGYADCNNTVGDGCESDLRNSVAHCGGCGRACVADNGIAACVAGSCTIGLCQPGFADCDRAVGNGCEIDTRVSLSHCGGCNRVCNLVGAEVECRIGTCAIRSCLPGRADCDRQTSSGCEVELSSDGANCGRCGLVCSGMTRCVGGSCL
ncbi:MAG: hypothetical protein Q8Q09_17530 [Deltaproteobacteria bacterium]|nr:hypothetical protein [Deltaproteobacteria bacterium]